MQHKRRPRNDRELPKPAIADVLAEMGADPGDIPTGFGWVRMRCPFHEDRTASAAVNHDPETGGFVCHANDTCPRGDAIKLLQLGLGLTFRDAVKRASDLSTESGKGHSRKAPKRRASDLLKGML